MPSQKNLSSGPRQARIDMFTSSPRNQVNSAESNHVTQRKHRKSEQFEILTQSPVVAHKPLEEVNHFRTPSCSTDSSNHTPSKKRRRETEDDHEVEHVPQHHDETGFSDDGSDNRNIIGTVNMPTTSAHRGHDDNTGDSDDGASVVSPKTQRKQDNESKGFIQSKLVENFAKMMKEYGLSSEESKLLCYLRINSSLDNEQQKNIVRLAWEIDFYEKLGEGMTKFDSKEAQESFVDFCSSRIPFVRARHYRVPKSAAGPKVKNKVASVAAEPAPGETKVEDMSPTEFEELRRMKDKLLTGPMPEPVQPISASLCYKEASDANLFLSRAGLDERPKYFASLFGSVLNPTLQPSRQEYIAALKNYGYEVNNSKSFDLIERARIWANWESYLKSKGAPAVEKCMSDGKLSGAFMARQKQTNFAGWLVAGLPTRMPNQAFKCLVDIIARDSNGPRDEPTAETDERLLAHCVLDSDTPLSKVASKLRLDPEMSRVRFHARVIATSPLQKPTMSLFMAAMKEVTGMPTDHTLIMKAAREDLDVNFKTVSKTMTRLQSETPEAIDGTDLPSIPKKKTLKKKWRQLMSWISDVYPNGVPGAFNIMDTYFDVNKFHEKHTSLNNSLQVLITLKTIVDDGDIGETINWSAVREKYQELSGTKTDATSDDLRNNFQRCMTPWTNKIQHHFASATERINHMYEELVNNDDFTIEDVIACASSTTNN